MPFSELQSGPLGELSRDEERGLVLENGKRVLTFRVKTFQGLVDRLIEMAGSVVARTILHQLGNEIGQTALQYSRDKIVGDNLAKIFDSVLRTRGWGRMFSLEKKGDVYVATVSDCPLCYEKKATEPACDLMRGIVAGWMEAFLERKAQLSVEKECAAIQGQSCVFEVTF